MSEEPVLISQEDSVALASLLALKRPFDFDPRGLNLQVLIHGKGRTYRGDGDSFAEAAAKAVKCYTQKSGDE